MHLPAAQAAVCVFKNRVRERRLDKSRISMAGLVLCCCAVVFWVWCMREVQWVVHSRELRQEPRAKQAPRSTTLPRSPHGPVGCSQSPTTLTPQTRGRASPLHWPSTGAHWCCPLALPLPATRCPPPTHCPFGGLVPTVSQPTARCPLLAARCPLAVHQLPPTNPQSSPRQSRRLSSSSTFFPPPPPTPSCRCTERQEHTTALPVLFFIFLSPALHFPTFAPRSEIPEIPIFFVSFF